MGRVSSLWMSTIVHPGDASASRRAYCGAIPARRITSFRFSISAETNVPRSAARRAIERRRGASGVGSGWVGNFRLDKHPIAGGSVTMTQRRRPPARHLGE